MLFWFYCRAGVFPRTTGTNNYCFCYWHIINYNTHLKPPLNGVNRRSGPLPQVGGASLPRMRRHCRSHSTWSHEFIHALCDSSHLSSFVVRSLRCLLVYLCDGSPSPIGARHPLLKRPPHIPPRQEVEAVVGDAVRARGRLRLVGRHLGWRTTTYPSPLMPSWH